ncbi:MAG: type II toxin-antitoxin system VapC family toxin [Defluviitaleaceae bacterium]|nr:type II toxin-antitoxin system VapC family toxin [Defluviitaleaceae bacterium]
MKIYVLDACAVIAALSNEKGADKVEAAYNEASSGNARIIINIVNLLEVYYDDYRIHGKESADKMVESIMASQTTVVSEIKQDVFAEAGRLKANYRISLADAFALAQAKVTKGVLLTSDHHEFDVIEANEPVQFLWIR